MPKSQTSELLPLTESEGPSEAILTIMPRADAAAAQAKKAADEKKAADLAAKKAAAAPDAEKLRMFAAAMEEIPLPILKNHAALDAAQEAMDECISALKRIATNLTGGIL